MVETKNIGKTDDYVYDISLDGTVVNALGCNIAKQTDGFNFQLPQKFRYTDDNPYISTGLSRETKEGEKYTGFMGDLAEFNDIFMRDFHYSDKAINKSGLGLDEVVDATINFSRKNYADYFPENPFPEDVKLVGNTIKSKKMPEYISKFLEKGIRLLLQNNGKGFLDEYYSYIEKIYNCQIPLKQIASKGKVKKTIKEYKEDCKTVTKAGVPKARQAWMELAINNNLDVHLGETIYYINVGTSKSHADLKTIKHYYGTDSETGERVENRIKLEKEYKQSPNGKLATGKDKISFDNYVTKYHPEIIIEREIALNCILLPNDIINSDSDVFCNEDEEYNIPKYIDQFNKRIKPLIVCFNPDIRGMILIDNPSKRPFFTDEQCKLDSGHPNKPSDQDTYEQLMTMEDKEIKFWLNHPEWKIPFLEECGMNWEEITKDYKERMEKEHQLGIDKIRETYEEAVSEMTQDELNDFIENGKLPKTISDLVTIDAETDNFMSKDFPDTIIGSIRDIIDVISQRNELSENVM